ncbi:hypothetical protein M9H77_22170 [Catharanthus roseus]|uniref:Uncharacterized protein n=1 Tax=Catharanthus roseus TaxID=4058 RepID=A0ACC0APC4_CATRO|nr:hypothetical protein M9H77_22170 [Catharanthus roseus]
MGSGSPIDDLVEYGTIRLLDWNGSMTDIQLDMRFVDKVQAVSPIRKYSISMGCEYRVLKIANDPEIPVSNIVQEVQCVEKMGQEQILTCRRYIREKRTEELIKRIFIRSLVRTFGGMFLLI